MRKKKNIARALVSRDIKFDYCETLTQPTSDSQAKHRIHGLMKCILYGK